MTRDCTFLIVGGGIAGVSCAESLAICCPETSILLITESNIVKSVTNLVPVARYLHKFDVREKNVNELGTNISTIVDQLSHVQSCEHWARTKTGQVINYRYLCLCTGGAPKLFNTTDKQLEDRIIGIRDTDSVLELQRRLTNAKDVLILGNGGIASELAYELRDVNVHWVIKDAYISATFVDPGAAEFFQLSRGEIGPETSVAPTAVKRMRYSELLPKPEEAQFNRGAALGPDWHRCYDLSGIGADQRLPKIYYKSHIEKLEHSTDKDALRVTLKHDDNESVEQVNCDFIVSATGVQPCHDYTSDAPLHLTEDGGIAVDEMMRTNLCDIYAAGDVCTSNWAPATHWFQMRLWTQARQMGAMAGRSMAASHDGETIYQDFCFELFGHVTQLFGYPVVLLGRFNGQGLGQEYELLVRCTRNKEYIKFVLQNGRLRGAILIGDTDLAETCENLILNGTDLEPYGDDILNPDIDIEDYFD